MTAREFDAVHALIQQTLQVAAEHTDPLAVLTVVLRMVAQSDADPYLLLGVLVAGMVATIAEKIPAERQKLVAEAVPRMLADHLKQRDII